MTSPRLTDRITAWLVRWRWVGLLLAGVLCALSWGPSGSLQFDRSIENMFPADHPLLVPFRRAKRIFGGHEIALAAYVDSELLTSQGMERLERLTQSLGEVPGVTDVLSLTSTPAGTELIHTPLLESFLTLLEGYTVGADRQTAAVVCMLESEDRATVDREQTVDELRRRVVAHDASGVLTGEPVMVVDGFRYLEEDGLLLGRASTVLLMGTIVLCFRSLRWVIVPMAVVNVTLLLTKGLLAAGRFRLSMVSSMLWAIITVVGVGMVVHIILRFREERHRGLGPREALLACGGVLLMPIVWTCLTDTAGFGALLAAKVGPVQDFGKMMTLGSLLSLLSVAMVLPGLALAGHFDPDPQRAWGERALDLGLSRVVRTVERWPRLIGLFVVLSVGGAMLGYLWLDVETDFTKNFRASSPVVRSYQFVETRLGGAGVWEVFLPAPDQLDRPFLDRVRRLENRLRSEVIVENEAGQPVPGLTKVLSLTDCLDSLGLPPEIPLEFSLQQFAQQMPAVWHSLWGEDPDLAGQHYLRIMLRARERQPSSQKNLLIDTVTRITREEFPDAEVTGFFILLTNLIDSMIGDQWTTFAIASALIAVMMLVAFGSPALTVAAMIPNLIPNLTVIGLMGWMGLRINMGAAMIAAVSMGLAVDSSVHYITEFRHFRRQGLSVFEAIATVHQSVGRAVVFSTLALMVGFSALCLSQFVPLIYFGVLVSVSLFGGMLSNLIVLPLLLRLLAPDEPLAGPHAKSAEGRATIETAAP